MEWDQAASDRLAKVPFFIRGKVKKQIEEYVRRQGGEIVTDNQVAAARRELVGGEAAGGEVSAPQQKLSGDLPAGIDQDQIEMIMEKGVQLEGLNTRHRQVKVCGGAAGCPLSLIEDRRVASVLAGVLEKSGLDGHLSGGAGGPVLYHQKFRLALAGCPNSCSQPQIVDFGVQGQSRPGRGEDPCSDCGQCLKVCRENAVSLDGEGPSFDYSRCLNCGQCIRACPTGAIREEQSGYRVLLGGKLGRHPRLAATILDLAAEDQVLATLEGALRVFMEHGRKGERLGGLADRLGPGRLKELVLAGMPGGIGDTT